MASLNLNRSLRKANKRNTSNTENAVSVNEEVIVITDNLKEKLGDVKISISTIHIIIKECIELLENLNIPGNEKKKHAIIIINALLNDFVENKEQYDVLIKIIDEHLIENTIDLIIDSSKGKININSKKNKTIIVGCITLFINLLKKK